MIGAILIEVHMLPTTKFNSKVYFSF